MLNPIRQALLDYILGTKPGASVVLRQIFVCNAPKAIGTHPIYVATKSLKHAYDRRPDFVVNNVDDLFHTLAAPDYIVKNVGTKRGDLIFVKEMPRGKIFACPIETVRVACGYAYFCLSFFPSKKPYVNKHPVLWSREGGGISPS